MATTSPEILVKGKWQDRTPGKIPVISSFIQRVKTGPRKGQDVKTTRRILVLPQNALSGDYDVDWERIDLDKIKFPTPDDPDRLHTHDGFDGNHPVSLVHPLNSDVNSDHRDEKATYERNYHILTKQRDEWERIHLSETKKLELDKSRLEKKKVKTKQDRIAIDELQNEIDRNKWMLQEIAYKDKPDWMEQLNVQIEIDKKIAYNGKKYKGDFYYIPEAGNTVWLWSEHDRVDNNLKSATATGDIYYLYVKGLKLEKYLHSGGALSRLEDLFTNNETRLSLGLSTPKIEKEREKEEKKAKEENRGKLTSLLERSNQLERRVKARAKKKEAEKAAKKLLRAQRKLEREKEALAVKKRKAERAAKRKAWEERPRKKMGRPVGTIKKKPNEQQSPTTKKQVRKDLLSKLDNFIKSCETESTPEIKEFEVFSTFKSGDNSVTLEGNKEQYKVSTNSVPSIVTSEFREALAKYYSSVSKIIDSQNEDKDIGLELFGDHVLQTSRNARKLMAELDKMVEVKMLENLDYTQLKLPFDSEFIMKYDPQGSFFGIVPPPSSSDETECKNDDGRSIGRKDLTDEDYKNEKPDEENQEVIEEDQAQNPGLGSSGPSIITNSLNQYQMIPVRQEEAKRVEVVEKPLKVENTYQQKLKVPENAVIEQG